MPQSALLCQNNVDCQLLFAYFSSQSPAKCKQDLLSFFLSAFLRNFFLCQDHWRDDELPHLPQPCYIALRLARDLGLISNTFCILFISCDLTNNTSTLSSPSLAGIRDWYQTTTKYYNYALDLLAMVPAPVTLFIEDIFLRLVIHFAML